MVATWRPFAATVGAVLVGAVSGAIAAPAVSLAQGQCLPPGEAVAPVPWSQQLLGPDRVWPLSSGRGQRVAVISTGVADTPFLAGTVAGQVDLSPPPQFGDPSGEPDCLGLGTAVAGIVAAPPTDGVGFHGMAPGARILDAKVVGDQYPSGREPSDTVAPDALASGIDWAVDQDATVIVVGTITYQDGAGLLEALDRALAAGIVVVAPVGEPGQEGEPAGLVPYPAGYEGVIGVAAIAADGTAGASRASHVDLVAPGVEVVTTYPGDGLGPASGSALAAAYVAGSVALVRAYQPDLSPGEVAHRLFATAAPAPEGVGSPRYGYGIVNPYQAMLDRVVAGEPAALPPFVPVEVSEEERARLAAQQRSDALAARLVLVGLGLAVAVAAAVGFGTRGRRRRWRSGLAVVPPDEPEADRPEPPRELFSSVR